MSLVVLMKMKELLGEEVVVKTTCVVDVNGVGNCPSMMAIKAVIVAADDLQMMMMEVMLDVVDEQW